MIRRPPRSTRTDTLFPYTTLFRSSYRSIAVLYQDFLVPCRIHRLPGEPLDLPAFRRRLTIARAGVGNDTASSVEWPRATEMAGGLSADIPGRTVRRRAGKEWGSTGRYRWRASVSNRNKMSKTKLTN